MSIARVLERIIVRTAVKVSRNKGSVAIGGLGAVLLGGFLFSQALPGAQVQNVRAAGLTTGTDCADTVMHAIAERTPSAARAGYRCIGGEMAAGLTEEAFVRQMSGGLPGGAQLNVGLTRVAEHSTPAGERIVFYVMDNDHEGVGYIVYLGPDGKVAKIE